MNKVFDTNIRKGISIPMQKSISFLYVKKLNNTLLSINLKYSNERKAII